MPGQSFVVPPVLYTATQWMIIAGLVVVALGIKALVAWWLYKDATARDRAPWGWVIGALFSVVITLIVWLIVRPVRPRGTDTNAGAQANAAAATAAADPYRVGFGQMAPDPRTANLEAVPEAPDASKAVAPPGAVVVTCPRCRHRVTVVRNPTGPTPLRCDNCGATGRL